MNCIPCMHIKARHYSCHKYCLLKIASQLSGADTSWGQRMLTSVGRAPMLRFSMASSLCHPHQLHRGEQTGRPGIMAPHFLPLWQLCSLSSGSSTWRSSSTSFTLKWWQTCLGLLQTAFFWVSESRSHLLCQILHQQRHLRIHLNLFSSAGVSTESEEKENIFC